VKVKGGVFVKRKKGSLGRRFQAALGMSTSNSAPASSLLTQATLPTAHKHHIIPIYCARDLDSQTAYLRHLSHSNSYRKSSAADSAALTRPASGPIHLEQPHTLIRQCQTRQHLVRPNQAAASSWCCLERLLSARYATAPRQLRLRPPY